LLLVSLHCCMHALQAATALILFINKQSNMTSLNLHDPISYNNEKEGIIVYKGIPDGETEEWMGICLTGPSAGTGDSNGTFNKRMYFSCPDQNAVWVNSGKSELVTKRTNVSKLEALRLRREFMSPTKKGKTTTGTTTQRKTIRSKGTTTTDDRKQRLSEIRERREALSKTKLQELKELREKREAAKLSSNSDAMSTASSAATGDAENTEVIVLKQKLLKITKELNVKNKEFANVTKELEASQKQSEDLIKKVQELEGKLVSRSSRSLTIPTYSDVTALQEQVDRLKEELEDERLTNDILTKELASYKNRGGDLNTIVSSDDENERFLQPNNTQAASTMKNETIQFLQYADGLMTCRQTYEEAYQKKIAHANMLARTIHSEGILLQNLGNKNKDYKASFQQQTIHGQPVQTLEELYQAADLALVSLEQFLMPLATTTNQLEGLQIDLASLKQRERALKKAQHDYQQRRVIVDSGDTADSSSSSSEYAWLYDIVSGEVVCDSMEQFELVLEWMQVNAPVVVQAKNRFASPTFTGYRDVLFHIQLPVVEDNRKFKHICEIQIHVRDIMMGGEQLLTASNESQSSHVYYEYFRNYFHNTEDSSSPSSSKKRIQEERLQDLVYIQKNFPQAMDANQMIAFTEGLIAMVTGDDENDGDANKNSTTDWLSLRQRLHALAELFHTALYEYDIAIQLYSKALYLTGTAGDNDNDDDVIQNKYVADTNCAIAQVLYDQGKLTESLELYETSLQLRLLVLEKSNDTDNDAEQQLDVASSYHHMARVLWRQGKLDDSKVLFEKALTIRLKYLDNNDDSTHTHYDVIDSYYKLAIVLDDQEYLEEAMELYEQKVLSAWIATLGDEHAEVSAIYSNMANVKSRMGQLEEEMEYYQKALLIKKKTVGEFHSSVADTYNNMACVHDERGELIGAMDLYHKALELWKQILGEDHSNVADTYYNISIVLEKQGMLTEAANACAKALEVYRHVHGPDHVETMDAEREWLRLQDNIEGENQRDYDASDSSSSGSSSGSSGQNVKEERRGDEEQGTSSSGGSQ